MTKNQEWLLSVLLLVLICLLTYSAFSYLSHARDKMRQHDLDTTVLTIGTKAPCIAKINLSAWDQMNAAGVYRWVTACEDKL